MKGIAHPLLMSALLLTVLLTGACSARQADAPAFTAQGERVYPFHATSTTDTRFQNVLVTREGTFEWRTLRITADARALELGTRLTVVLDLDIENIGSSDFRLNDYAVFLGLPLEREWRYRLLFSRSHVDLIPAGESRSLRYSVQLPGHEVPRDYALVFQNILGGRDVAFSFHRTPPGFTAPSSERAVHLRSENMGSE